MNTRSIEHVVFMPSTVTKPASAVQVRQSTSRPSGLEALALSALRWLATWPRRRAVIGELQRLSDRELADIGLSRNEIGTIFTRAR